jgi:hypothetical protein
MFGGGVDARVDRDYRHATPKENRKACIARARKNVYRSANALNEAAALHESSEQKTFFSLE